MTSAKNGNPELHLGMYCEHSYFSYKNIKK